MDLNDIFYITLLTANTYRFFFSLKSTSYFHAQIKQEKNTVLCITYLLNHSHANFIGLLSISFLQTGLHMGLQIFIIMPNHIPGRETNRLSRDEHPLNIFHVILFGRTRLNTELLFFFTLKSFPSCVLCFTLRGNCFFLLE